MKCPMCGRAGQFVSQKWYADAVKPGVFHGSFECRGCAIDQYDAKQRDAADRK